MIALSTDYRLGKRAFVVLACRSTIIAIFLFIIAVILLLSGPALIEIVNKIIIAASGQNDATVNSSHLVFFAIAVVFLLSFLIFAIGVFINYLQYNFFTFRFEEFDIKLKKGIFNISETSIPYRQIQDVDVTRDIFYRMFGVSRLVLLTAGHDDPGDDDNSDTVFDPIDNSLAEDIRLLLQQKIGVQIVESQADAKQSQ